MSDQSGCIAFVDLDDTLFSSLRRQGATPDLTPAATLVDGSVICFANSAQRALYRMLTATATLVPVTARNVAALRRVLLPLQGAAICSHGATILRADGAVDADWKEMMAPRLARARDELVDFVSRIGRLKDHRGEPLRTWLVDDGGDPSYAVVKHHSHDHDALRVLAETTVVDWLRERPGYRVQVNGNNLAVLPPGVAKAEAVAHMIAGFRDRNLPKVIIGAADGDADLEFLDLCDIMLLPGRSQLADSLRRGVADHEVAHA